MRNVTRITRPACLAKNADNWRQEFLAAIRTGNAKRIKQCRSRYNQKEVRQALDAMYCNLCCYCESQVGAVRADQIEHRMPVDLFGDHAFEWDNLHLACGGCNGAKSNKWDSQHPILDAVTDTPIENHLDYESRETGVRQVGLTQRGRTTIQHCDLNREKLRQTRSAVMAGVVGVIQQIRRRLHDDPTDVVAANGREALEEMYTERYGSMVRWAVATLL